MVLEMGDAGSLYVGTDGGTVVFRIDDYDGNHIGFAFKWWQEDGFHALYASLKPAGFDPLGKGTKESEWLKKHVVGELTTATGSAEFMQTYPKSVTEASDAAKAWLAAKPRRLDWATGETNDVVIASTPMTHVVLKATVVVWPK
ncbi:MAG: hypothetical protein H6700_08580 [Myxococcales bacterium]|nr:hypothetical protein [Myxococcales bacterium]MCB9520079.1 hypothetical protein [Myxococcales bacterium]MCB9531805.1 hypothetical protein [Myxococcales bacterium]